MRVFSFIYAAIFLSVGIIGFIPNTYPLLSQSTSLSVLYIVTGAWMLLVGISQRLFIRKSLQVIGLVYITLVILGFFFNLIGTGANIWFQFIMLVPAIIIGFSKVEERV